MVLRRFELDFHSDPLKQLAQVPNHVVDGISFFSYSSLATISANSYCTNSDSSGWPRSLASDARALATRPRLTKYRGESGRNRMPVPRMAAQMNWIPMGSRYDARDVQSAVE